MATRSTVISWLSKADESFLGTEGSDWWRSPIARIVIQYQPKRVILLSRNPEFASEVRHELHPKIKELASETEWLPVQYFPSQGISDEHNPARACRDIQAVVAKWKLNGDPYLIFNVIGGSAAMGQSAYWISSQLPGSPVLVMAPPIDRLPSDLTNLYVQEVEPLPSMTVSRAGTSPTTDDIPILDLGLPPDLARQVALLAKSQEPILILGEPGTGKSHLARAIHRLSCFSGAFVDLNCGTLSDRDRTRSELFGHVQGAYTGATKDHKGVFVQANQGTLFLDEIGTLPLDVQATLLQAMEEGKFRPLGSEKVIQHSARIITATNSDVFDTSTFRRDLADRLAGYVIRMPRLANRPEDIVKHAIFFMTELNRNQLAFGAENWHERTLADDALDQLRTYAWPGNIRELKRVVRTAGILANSPRGFVNANDIQTSMACRRGIDAPSAQSRILPDPFEVGLDKCIKELEGSAVQSAIEMSQGNLTEAARLLGFANPNSGRQIIKRIISENDRS